MERQTYYTYFDEDTGAVISSHLRMEDLITLIDHHYVSLMEDFLDSNYKPSDIYNTDKAIIRKDYIKNMECRIKRGDFNNCVRVEPHTAAVFTYSIGEVSGLSLEQAIVETIAAGYCERYEKWLENNYSGYDLLFKVTKEQTYGAYHSYVEAFVAGCKHKNIKMRVRYEQVED